VAAGRPRLTRGRRASLPGVHELPGPATRGTMAREPIAVLLAGLDAGVGSSLLARWLRGPDAAPAAGQAPAGAP